MQHDSQTQFKTSNHLQMHTYKAVDMARLKIYQLQVMVKR
jgi:hypothetical protein